MRKKDRRILTLLFISGIILIAIMLIGLLLVNSDTSDRNSSSETPPEKKITKVSFRMPFQYGFTAVATIVAKDKGYYAQEGLEVEIFPGQGSPVAVQAVGSGQNDFGAATGNAILIGAAKGIPVKALAVMAQHTGSGIIFPANSSIRFAKDIIGKRGSVDWKTASGQEFQLFIEHSNIDKDLIDVVSANGQAQRVQSVLTGKADYLSSAAYATVPMLEKEGMAARYLLYEDYGVDFYGFTIITNDNMIQNHPEVVRRFVHATLRGLEHAVQNPDEGLDAIIRAFPETDVVQERKRLLGWLELVNSRDTARYGYGYQSKERWENGQDMIYGTGIIEKKIDVSNMFTSEFLP